ncbi:Uncharacterized protein APZ42_034005 [Daphnia magna]|uniref:Uncharacterized protein n=1 Tax=Daphnia magna TaxID=35525 RepID=A0A164KJ25_9CRUS|nr:Uncharacterized protein APZ42_034005 [Daphnia magna]
MRKQGATQRPPLSRLLIYMNIHVTDGDACVRNGSWISGSTTERGCGIPNDSSKSLNSFFFLFYRWQSSHLITTSCSHISIEFGKESPRVTPICADSGYDPCNPPSVRNTFYLV